MKLIEQIKSKREWLKTTAENLGAFQAGAALAFTATYYSKMTMECFHDNALRQSLTNLQCYIIFFLLPLGAILGTLLSALLLYKIGRLKTILLLSTLPFLVAYTVMIFEHGIMMIYIGRIVIGCAVGCTYLVLPIYNAETCTGYSPKEVYITFFAYHAGGVWISFYMNGFGKTRTFCIFSAVISLISFLLTCFYLKESPYDLVKKGKLIDAENVLMEMKSRPRSDIDKELRAMEALAKQREATTYKDLRKEKWDINALIICAILFALPHCSGVMAFITFGQLFFDDLEVNPFSHRSPMDSVGQSGFIYFAISLLVFRILAKAEQREILRISIMVITGTLVVISLLYFDYQLELHIPMRMSWLPTLAFVCLLGCCSAGCSFFPWMIIMELFAPALVHNALVVMCIYFWSLYFVVGTLFFILMPYHFFLGLLFLAFAVCCGFEAYFVQFHLIDTKDKTYAEIKTMLSK